MPPGEHEPRPTAPASSTSPTLPAPKVGGRSARRVLGFFLALGSVLWVFDAGLLLAERPVHLSATLLGLWASLFFVLCVCTLLGGTLALATLLAASPAVPRGTPRLAVRIRAFLDDGSQAERVLRSGALLAVPPLFALYAAGSFLVGQRLVVGMARPELAALALLGLHLVLSALVLIAFPAFASLGSWLSLSLQRFPGLGRVLFGGPRHVLRWLLAGALLSSAVFVWLYREPLSYLPWRELLQLAAAMLVALTLTQLHVRLPRAMRVAIALLFSAVAATAAFAAFSLTPAQMFARRIAEHRTLSGRLGHAALMRVLDRDGDGYLPVLGGGDCAPFDASRNPAAIDVPGNRIDEDCDGRDLDAKELPRLGKYDHPVRADVPRRPPVVLITVDAFAASRMQALGEKRALTPNLDALAKSSVLFRRCFAQGPSTRLSFPAIFTSRWDSQIKTKLQGKHPFPIDASEQMLAEMMRSAGYDTVAIISDGYFARSRWSGLTAGFSRVIDTPYTQRPATPHSGPRVTFSAVEELTRERTQPLFLWVHYYDAHSPHSQPEGIASYGKTRSDIYAAELAFVDREVGKLLAQIAESTHGEALVIVTGDHGIAFDEPRHETFNYGYDLSTAVLHVPLIVHAPFLAPRTLDGVVSTMDIMPTLANLLRLRGPFPFQGESLVPELFDGEHSRPELLFHEMFLEERLWKNEEPLERASLRTGRYNLMHDRKTGFFELYDYQADYYEKNDLASDPRHEKTLFELRQKLLLYTYATRHAPAAAAAKPAVRPAASPRTPPAPPAMPAKPAPPPAPVPPPSPATGAR